VVLEPGRPASRGSPRDRRDLLEAVSGEDVDAIAANLARRDGDVISLAEIARLSRLSTAQVRQRLAADFDDLGAGRLASRGAVAEVRSAYLDRLAEAHRNAPARPAAPARAIRDALSRRGSRDLLAESSVDWRRTAPSGWSAARWRSPATTR